MEAVPLLFAIISIALQAIAAALTVGLASATRTGRTWVLVAMGLTLIVVYQALMLASTLGVVPLLAASMRGPLVEGIRVAASTCIVLGVLAIGSLFRRLTVAEAESLRQREALATMHRVGLMTTSTLTLDSLLQQIHDQVRQLVSFDAFYVALYDEASDELRLELIIENGRAQPKVTVKASRDGGLWAWIIRSRRALRIGDIEAERDRLPVVPQRVGVQLRSWLGLPLIAQDRAIGVMSIQSLQPNAFTADDERLLATVAAQAAMGIENARLYRSTQACEIRYRTLIENVNDWIWSLDREGNFTFANKQLERGSGYKLEDWIGKPFDPFIVPDDLPAVRRAFAETVVGKPQTFEANVLDVNGQTINLLVNLVPLIEEGQIVGMVGFGRDITNHKKVERELQRSNRELAALNAIAATVSQSLDMTKILNNTLDKALEVVQIEGEARGGIFLLDEKARELHLAALRGLPAEFIERESTVRLDRCLCGQVVETGGAIDATRVDVWHNRPGWVEPHGHLILPLKSKGKVLGVMFLYLPVAHRVSYQEMQLLTAIGNQIGMGIENVQLYERLLAQARDLELLYEVGRRLSSSLEPQQVLSQVATRCAQVFEANVCLVHLVEDDLLTARASYYREDTEGNEAAQRLSAKPFRVGEGIVGQVVATGQSALSSTFDVAQVTTLDDVDYWLSHEWLLMPLRAKGRIFGVLTLIARRERRRFTERDLALAQEVANQAAAALENARLYQETARSLARLQALSQVSRAASSSLDLHQVLTTIARYATELSGSDAAGIYELDEEQRVLHISASFNASLEFVQAANSVNIRVGQGVIGQAIATRRPAEVTDVQTDSNYPFLQLAAMEGYRSILAVPMVSREKLSGGVVVWRKQPQPFSKDVVGLLSTLADQSVVAIENARLYQAANRQLEVVSLIQAVALAGAAGRPFDDIVADATERLRHLWDSHHLGFLFPDEIGALQVHDSYVGLSAGMKRLIRFQPGDGVVGWVAQTGQPLVLPDVRHDPRYIEGSSETRSEMAAPLAVGDRVIGVINVESARLNAFSADDVHLLSALAGQLAVILDNTQAHQDLAKRAQQLEVAYAELAEVERLKEQLVQNLSHELRTPMTYVKGYVELIQDEAFGPLPPTLREPLAIVRQKTYIVERLMERIVTLQAVRTETLELEPLTLSDVIQETLDHWRPKALQAGIEIELDTPTNVPPVAADRRQLAEVFDNLLSNAIKFSPKGGQVKVRLRSEGEFVHAEVTDTGIGIQPDKLPKVFERFYQVDGTTRRRFGGTGVGLALVRQVVEAHGGQVWAESEGPGHGSTFHLAFPSAPIA
jgi:PAS domain S-box-containing protein